MSPFQLPATLPVATVEPGRPHWRVHRRYRSADFFNVSPDWRFNAPNNEFGVCYLGETLDVAFLEALVRGLKHRVVARKDLAACFGTALHVRRPVRLLQLHSEGLVALALSADFPQLVPYTGCQQLALELWRGYPEIDGIEYRSRWNDELLCVALFDRARDVLSLATRSIPLDDMAHMGGIFEKYRIAVV